MDTTILTLGNFTNFSPSNFSRFFPPNFVVKHLTRKLNYDVIQKFNKEEIYNTSVLQSFVYILLPLSKKSILNSSGLLKMSNIL